MRGLTDVEREVLIVAHRTSCRCGTPDDGGSFSPDELKAYSLLLARGLIFEVRCEIEGWLHPRLTGSGRIAFLADAAARGMVTV